MTTVSGPNSPAPRLNRRGFIRSTAVIGGQAVLMASKGHAAATSLQGYTGAPSVAVGGTIDFFLSDPQAVGAGTTVYPITFTRVGAPDVYMSSTTVGIGNQPVPADASTQGCRWSRSFRLSIPSSWPTGLYYAYVGSGGNACTVPFVVRPASPSAGVKTIVNVPMLTTHAYNAFGGKSIYDYNSTGGVRASQVSLDRPFSEAFNSFFDTWAQYLVRWMAKNNLAADFCTDWDIETDPSVLSGYQLYLQAGHDEYWSTGRRNTMDAFVARGGNCAYLAGNTAWFQSRLEAGVGGAHRTLVCYKDAAADPVQDPALKTINWIGLATPRPENSTDGLGFVTGAAWTSGTLPRPNTPSIVMRPEHWAFSGTGLTQGSGFAGAYIGYECNSAAFVNGSDGRAYPTGSDGTPATLRILAQADCSTWNDQSLAMGGTGEQSGHAAVAVFSRGGGAGTVFNAGTMDWPYGLRPELDGQTATPISRITLNVINQLVKPWTESADVRQFRNNVGGWSNAYYTTGTTAPAGSGMTLDGWAFRAYVSAVAGSVPIYRYRSAASDPSRVYYLLRTNSVAPPGMVADGVAFHAYPAYRSDAIAVFEHYLLNPTLGAVAAFYSTGATPPAGWTAGPVVFYTPTDSSVPTAPLPSFRLSAASATVSVVPGRSVTDAITVTPVNGFNGSVGFAASGLPAGVSASFATASGGTVLSLSATTSATPGSYPITISGSAPGTTGPASVGLTLVISPPPGFTLTGASALNLPLLGLLGGSTTIGVAGTNGFAGVVTFAASGLPAGLSASFAPSTSTTGTTLTISRSLFPPVPPGRYPVTVKGTSGTLSATVQVVLSIGVRS